MKLITLFFCVNIICLCSCNQGKQITKNIGCDTTTLNTDNKFNDTSKIIYIRGAIFDTLACMLNGLVIDQETYTPIKKAAILFHSAGIEFKSVTNDIGEFRIFNNAVCKQDLWQLEISHKDYQCSIVKYKQFTGGQWIKIKLKNRSQ